MEKIVLKKCISCGSKLDNPVMKFNNLPSSAQNIPTKDKIKFDKGIDLSLYKCPNCGLVQFNTEPVSYYRDVIRSSGFSSTMKEMRTNQIKHMIEKYDLKDKKFIEVGCGGGEFLEIFQNFPIKIYGIEHKHNLVEIAKNKELNVEELFTETEETSLVFKDKEKYDCFLSFNFLEHQPNPKIMLRCIANNLKEDGFGLITVPSFEFIVENGSYYEFIVDHIAYYTFESLRNLLNSCGFDVLEENFVNRDTLQVVVKKSNGHIKNFSNRKSLISFDRLLKSKELVLDNVNRFICKMNEENKTYAIWGASHQGFTLAATTPLGLNAKYVIDSATFKQGKFAPVFHKEIVAPKYFLDHPVDAIVIIAPGFSKEISNIIKREFIDENKMKVDIYTVQSEEVLKV